MKAPAWLIWSAIAALALVALGLLMRDMLVIPLHVPLDPDEGWNAAYAAAALAGRALYPTPDAMMVNNYPPLSFYIVGLLGRLTGDAIIAGRLISLLAFLATAALIAIVLRRAACGARAQMIAVAFFAGVLLIASDYVGMNDPQMLGHAVQVTALLMMIRRRLTLAALLFAASLFIKHNLLALPLAAGLWLGWQDRRAGLQFAAVLLAVAVAGLAMFHIVYGSDLAAHLASPRLTSFANVVVALRHLWWAPLPLLALGAMPQGKWKKFCLLYAGFAFALGMVFSTGDGVDANAFFDLVISLSLALGLALQADRAIPVILSCAPLLAFLALNFFDNNFFYTRDFARQSASDIAFMKTQPGPGLCEQLSLCLWAGKPAQADLFNLSEQYRMQTRSPAGLESLLHARYFAVIQMGDAQMLGPRVRAAILENYRADHSDDNGTFWIPRP